MKYQNGIQNYKPPQHITDIRIYTLFHFHSHEKQYGFLLLKTAIFYVERTISNDRTEFYQ